MLSYNDFKDVIDAIRKIDKFIDDAYGINIDMINSVLYNSVPTIYRVLFVNEFGEEGFDWITWYLYELPQVKKRCKNDNEVYASDKDGNKIDLNSDRKLYDFLVKDYLQEKGDTE